MKDSGKIAEVKTKRPSTTIRARGKKPIRRGSKAVDMVDHIDKSLAKQVTIHEGRRSRRVSVMEAIMLRLWRKGIDGDRSAMFAFMDYDTFANSLRPVSPHDRNIVLISETPSLMGRIGEGDV